MGKLLYFNLITAQTFGFKNCFKMVFITSFLSVVPGIFIFFVSVLSGPSKLYDKLFDRLLLFIGGCIVGRFSF